MAAGAIVLPLVAAGCSITMPFEKSPVSAVAADADITTSAITPRPPKDVPLPPGQVSPLSANLDAEDWRRARAALATALDPQGNGGQVRWENSDSGNKGVFGAVGNPYVVKDEICRAFVAGLTLKEPEQWFEGSACRVSASEWAIRDVRASKRSG
jgi:surface antigen